MKMIIVNSFVLILFVSSAYSTDVPADSLCNVNACAQIIMNNDPTDCLPGHELDECIKTKVLADESCKGNKKEATKSWLEQHKVEEQAHCGAKDVKEGCDFSVCQAKVVEIKNPTDCKKGREFIQCLREKVVTAEACKGEKKVKTEKGIEGLHATEETKCAAKAVYEGCLFMKQCGMLVDPTSKNCKESKKFIECIQTEVVLLDKNHTDCSDKKRALTKEGIKGLETHYKTHCISDPDSATNAVVSLITMLAAMITAVVFAH